MNLHWQDIWGHIIDFWHFKVLTIDKNAIEVGNLLLGVFFVVVGIRIARRSSQVLAQRLPDAIIEDASYRATIEAFAFYILVIFLTLFGLNIANIPLTVFTVVGGALAIGVGFGSQNIVNNFISGIILMFERPIKVGDFIEIDGTFGRVESIGFRSTRVISFGNRHIIVPNSSFLEQNVLNWTHIDHFVRVFVRVGVAYGSPVQEVRKYLIQAVEKINTVVKDPEPEVMFQDFGDNALIFDIYFSTRIHHIRDMMKIKSDIRFNIDEIFNQNSIVIAYPQRDVHLDSLSPIEVKITSESSSK